MENLASRVEYLLTAWHEAGREAFWAKYKNLPYDKEARKHSTERTRYIALDCDTIGCYLVDKTDGMVYCIKAYGVPNKKKCLGHINGVSGEALHARMYYR